MHKILREVMMVLIITVIAAMVSCAFIREGKTAQQVIIMYLVTGNNAIKLAKYDDMATCMQDTMQWKGAGKSSFAIVCIDISNGVPYVGR